MPHKTLLSIVCLLSAGLLSGHAQAQANCSLPFQRNGTVTMPVGYSGATASVAVPTGYRLRLDMITVSQSMLTNPSRAAVEVATRAGGYYGVHSLPVQEGYYPSHRVAHHQVSMYADSGTPVFIRAYRGNETSTASHAWYTISGCLIP